MLYQPGYFIKRHHTNLNAITWLRHIPAIFSCDSPSYHTNLRDGKYFIFLIAKIPIPTSLWLKRRPPPLPIFRQMSPKMVRIKYASMFFFTAHRKLISLTGWCVRWVVGVLFIVQQYLVHAAFCCWHKMIKRIKRNDIALSLFTENATRIVLSFDI